jgi:hypothetical protein
MGRQAAANVKKECRVPARTSSKALSTGHNGMPHKHRLVVRYRGENRTAEQHSALKLSKS